MSLNNRALKIAGGGLTIIGLLFTGFLAHDARYAKAEDVKRIESQVSRDMADLKVELLESRRQAILRDLRQTTNPLVRQDLQEMLDATERKLRREELRLQGLETK